jgi:acyl dehydratase
MSGELLHFEDFTTGRIFDCGCRVVTKEEILDFAREFDPQPHHLDEEAARLSLLGGLAAPGFHVCALAMRIFVDGLLGKTANRGGTGVDDCRWLKPVRPGDRLRLEVQVTERRESTSRPEIGYVTFEWRLFNEKEPVATMIATVMPERRRVPA